jgi:hypothetical protein
MTGGRDELRLNLTSLGAAGFGVGGTGAVIGFLDQSMRFGHELFSSDFNAQFCLLFGRPIIVNRHLRRKCSKTGGGAIPAYWNFIIAHWRNSPDFATIRPCTDFRSFSSPPWLPLWRWRS